MKSKEEEKEEEEEEEVVGDDYDDDQDEKESWKGWLWNDVKKFFLIKSKQKSDKMKCRLDDRVGK